MVVELKESGVCLSLFLVLFGRVSRLRGGWLDRGGLCERRLCGV